MDVDAFCERIGYDGARDPNADVLQALHRAFVLSVPFENLDIHLGRPILLDEAALFDKIVKRRRGGFCYEMNGLFAALLRALGFDVTLLSARVVGTDGKAGPEFDHLVLLVPLSERRLADVGFGDAFVHPLRLDASGEQPDDKGPCRIARDGGKRAVERRTPEGAWKTLYFFTETPRRLDEFAGMCRYHQTSPDSPFTQKRFTTKPTGTGQVTLSEHTLIVTEQGTRTERELSGEEEYRSVLREQFDLVV